VELLDAGRPAAPPEEDPVTTPALDRSHTVHLAEMAVAAVGLQYGLARLLARAVEAGTRSEDRHAVPHQRPGSGAAQV
jgi:hypothetical protein